MWENNIFVEETPNGPAPVAHVVYLGAGAIAQSAKTVTEDQPLTQPTAQDFLKQNPTLASCLQEAKDLKAETAIVTLPGNPENTIMVSKSLWPSSGDSSSTTISTTTRATPVSSAGGTPIKPMFTVSASASNQQQSEPTRSGTDTIDPDERRQLASEQIAEEVKNLSEAARVLSADFMAISSATHKRWHEMRHRRLQGVDTMRKKVQAALLEWKAQVSARQCLLQSAPSVGVYNSIVEDIRAETFELTSAIGSATEDYENSQETTAKDIEKMRVQFLNELQLMIESAISRFIDEASTGLYTQFGDSPEIVPHMANTAGVASNFRSITQCVTMMLTLMPEDIQHDLSIAELDMFSTVARIIPSLCPVPNKSGLPPVPDEELGDLVGKEAIAGGDQDKEKIVSSTSADVSSHSAKTRSRSNTPARSREGSQSRITPQVPFSVGQLFSAREQEYYTLQAGR